PSPGTYDRPSPMPQPDPEENRVSPWMLAPNPSQHLESEIPFPGNLEASVRSRGTGVGRRRDRDLIEAGLSEPAGWRARLWGLCRQLVREPPSAEAGDDLGRLMASGGGECGRQIRVGEVVLPVIAANPVTCRIGALTANGMVPAGAIGVRWRKSGTAGWQ